jgi:hypothetical protein
MHYNAYVHIYSDGSLLDSLQNLIPGQSFVLVKQSQQRFYLVHITLSACILKVHMEQNGIAASFAALCSLVVKVDR